MARKKIADQEPAISAERTAAAPAKAVAGGKSDPKQARAPRSSANAVTHRHKIATTTESSMPSQTIKEELVTAPSAPAIAQTPAAPKIASRSVESPAHDEIAVRAYLIAEARGFENGSPEDDWFAAEMSLWAERTTK